MSQQGDALKAQSQKAGAHIASRQGFLAFIHVGLWSLMLTHVDEQAQKSKPAGRVALGLVEWCLRSRRSLRGRR